MRFLVLVLASYTASAARAQTPQPPPVEETAEETDTLKDPSEIKAALADVLKDPEFRRIAPKEPEKKKEEKKKSSLPPWLERLLEKIFGSGEKERKGSSSPGLALGFFSVLTWLLYGAVALAFAAVVFWIGRSVLRRSEKTRTGDGRRRASSTEAILPATPPGEQPAEEYVREALRLAQAGKHREAIRQLLLGTMSWIERNDLIRFRKGLTNRDYLRAVWQQPKRREPLAALVLVFDQIYFGRRPATPERFEECLGYFRSGFSSP